MWLCFGVFFNDFFLGGVFGFFRLVFVVSFGLSFFGVWVVGVGDFEVVCLGFWCVLFVVCVVLVVVGEEVYVLREV